MPDSSLKGYYILFSDIAYISGGSIYCRNKALFMSELGWNVKIVPNRKAESKIDGMSQFAISSFPFINSHPNTFPRRIRNQFLKTLCTKLNIDNHLPVVIETGNFYTALWGELLAEMLKAKHIIEFQDEFNKSVDRYNYNFFKFKFERNELACISKEAMKRIFGPYWEINDNNAIGLPFSCSNSIADFHSDICKFPSVDFIIGYIGRTDKLFVSNIAKGIRDFACKHTEKTVLFVMFGGPLKAVEVIKPYLELSNIKLFVTDFMYPLPLQDLKKCDVFLAGAGSSLVAAKSGIPAINIDIYSYCPTGFWVDVKQRVLEPCRRGNSIVDYLEQILIIKDIPQIQLYDFRDEERTMRIQMDKHVKFLETSVETHLYFSTEKLPLMGRKWIRKILYSFLPSSWVFEIEKNRYLN